MKANQLFWQNEIGDRCKQPENPYKGKGFGSPFKGSPKRDRNRSRSGRGRDSPWSPVPHWTSDSPKGKSKGGKKGKDNGSSQARQKWVSANKNQVSYCWDWNNGRCNNPKCWKIHRCCVATGKGGVACNKRHPACEHRNGN